MLEFFSKGLTKRGIMTDKSLMLAGGNMGIKYTCEWCEPSDMPEKESDKCKVIYCKKSSK